MGCTLCHPLNFFPHSFALENGWDIKISNAQHDMVNDCKFLDSDFRLQVFGLSVRAADSAVQPRQDSSRVKACFAGSVWSTASVWPESVLVRAAACAALLSLAAAAAAVAEAGDGAVEVRAPKPSRMVRCGGIVVLLRASRRHTSARHSLTS